MGAGNSAVVVDLPRWGPMLSPRVPNLVPIPGPRMERETPGQRPRSNYGHPQGQAHDPDENVVWVGDHPVWTRPESAAKLVNGVLLGHGLVLVEASAEPAIDFAATPQRRSSADVAVSKLAQAHTVANQFRHVVDVHADQLRASPNRGAHFTASNSGTRSGSAPIAVSHAQWDCCAVASQAILPTTSSLTWGFADPHTHRCPAEPHPLGKAATRPKGREIALLTPKPTPPVPADTARGVRRGRRVPRGSVHGRERLLRSGCQHSRRCAGRGRLRDRLAASDSTRAADADCARSCRAERSRSGGRSERLSCWCSSQASGPAWHADKRRQTITW